MRSQLIDILKSVAFEEGIIPSYTDTIPSDKKTQLLDIANDVKQEVAEKCDLSALLQEFYFQTYASYTTGTVAIVKDAVLLTITTGVFTSAMVGRKIQISGDPTIYEIKKFVNVAVVWINRPFMAATVTAATFTIFAEIYDLGQEVFKVLALLPQNDRDIVFRKLHPKELMRKFPNPVRCLTDPIFYAPFGSRQNVTSVTATAVSDNTVTFAGGSTFWDDYYVGFIYRNRTLSKTARVTAFDVTTGVVTFDTAITGQAITDTIDLIQNTAKVILRNVPTEAIWVRGVGFRPPTKFVNDYDIDFEIPEDYSDRILKIGIKWMYRLADPGRTELTQADFTVKKEYENTINELEDYEEVKEYQDKIYGFGEGYIESNPLTGAAWPRSD